MGDIPQPRGNGFFEWINRHSRAVAIIIIIGSLALAVSGLAIRIADKNPQSPKFNPSGEIFDAAERAEDLFDLDAPIAVATFIVEAPEGVDGDVLRRDALLEWVENAASVEASEESARHLTSNFDNDLGIEVNGIYSIAHAVDEHLAGGLVAATDADVKVALDELLSDGSSAAPMRTTLSQRASASPGTVAEQEIIVWTSPAFRSDVVYLRESFTITDPDSADEDLVEHQYTLEAEKWLRSIQTQLQGDQAHMAALGLAIDQNLTDDEQGEAAAPFILLAIVVILFLVGVMVRSYWATVIVASGLTLTFMTYLGVTALAGIKGSLLIVFIVPITVISFGVDFFVHASGRCREEQEAGSSRARAYPLGLTAVGAAILLAVTTSILAFVANTVSGIEAVAQFGIAAAMGLAIAYGYLGLIAPKILLATEDKLGDPPVHHGLRLGSKLGFVLMSLTAGVVVTYAILSPPMGWGLFFVVFLPVFVALPFWYTKRRNARAAAAGRDPDTRIRGAGHGVRVAGSLVHLLARWRLITIPAVLVLAVMGLFLATRVEQRFEPSDFISSKTDLIRGVNLLQTHFGSSIGGEGFILIEGDLTDPGTVAAIEAIYTDVDAADAAADESFIARDFDGVLITTPNAASVVREVTSSGTARAAVATTTGVEITDDDGDGLADTSQQVDAVYAYAYDNGVVNDAGQTVLRTDQVRGVLAVGDGTQATLVTVGIPTLTDAVIIERARQALDGAVADFSGDVEGAITATVSGESIADQVSLDAFTRSMVLAVPLAMLLCAAVAWLFMRSLRYALVSVVPILLVVGWIYAFMYAFDYAINPVTATIAAIAVGVGVDYAMHFTMRFREEFKEEPSRFPALRRAGEGTGGALVISALTSIAGFLVMAMAPMPIIAAFGLLTAVMIFLSLVVSLLVLPSLLLLVTPSRKGETRRFLEQSLTGEGEEYDPHSRETALRHHVPEGVPTG